MNRVFAVLATGLLIGNMVWSMPAEARQLNELTDILILQYHTFMAPKPRVMANTSGIDLSGMMLTQSDMRNQNYALTNFHRAVLNSSDMRFGIFRGANFSEANMNGADMRKADFVGANFRGTNLTGADLKGTRLVNATYDKHTVFPEYFVPEDHGMVFVND